MPKNQNDAQVEATEVQTADVQTAEKAIAWETFATRPNLDMLTDSDIGARVRELWATLPESIMQGVGGSDERERTRFKLEQSVGLFFVGFADFAGDSNYGIGLAKACTLNTAPTAETACTRALREYEAALKSYAIVKAIDAGAAELVIKAPREALIKAFSDARSKVKATPEQNAAFKAYRDAWRTEMATKTGLKIGSKVRQTVNPKSGKPEFEPDF
jgi:hypothetical protein